MTHPASAPRFGQIAKAAPQKSALRFANAVASGAACGVLLALSGGALAAPHGLNFGKTEGKDLPPSAGRDALRQIVQDQCIPRWVQHKDPAPCDRVVLADEKNLNSGYAILADRKGAAHYLLIPTQTMHGVDADEILNPDLPNYFAQAWSARDVITKFVGHPVPRTAIGLAVNKAHARTQDQFHIHIDCLRQDVAEALHAGAENATTAWGPIALLGSAYQIKRIEGLSLDGISVFESVAQIGPDVRHHIGDYTVVIAGMQYRNGAGFMLITGTGQTGELLLDSSCAIAGAGG